MEYSHGQHCTYLLTYHFVFVTKYRRKVRSKCRDEISSQLWGDSFWSENYFAATTGTVSMEAVKQYIDSQKTDSHRRKHVKKSNRWKPEAETLQ